MSKHEMRMRLLLPATILNVQSTVKEACLGCVEKITHPDTVGVGIVVHMDDEKNIFSEPMPKIASAEPCPLRNASLKIQREDIIIMKINEHSSDNEECSGGVMPNTKSLKYVFEVCLTIPKSDLEGIMSHFCASYDLSDMRTYVREDHISLLIVEGSKVSLPDEWDVFFGQLKQSIHGVTPSVLKDLSISHVSISTHERSLYGKIGDSTLTSRKPKELKRNGVA